METVKKYGIKNVLPIVMLGVEMGNIADKMGRTKGMARYMHITSLFDEVMALGSVDFSQVKLELKDLDATERATIEKDIKDKFDIVDKNLEGVIEEAINIIESAVIVITRSVTMVGKIKALKNA